MDPDSLHWNIVIQGPESLLGWLMIISAMAGTSLLMIMLAIEPFFFLPDGSKFTLMQLQLPRKLGPFKNIVTTASKKVKGAVRLQLKLDYFFMIFAAGFLLFAGAFVMHLVEKQDPALRGWKLLLIAPVIAWLADIVENILIASSLNKYSPGKIKCLFFVSLIKWSIVCLYVIFFLLLWLWVLI